MALFFAFFTISYFETFSFRFQYALFFAFPHYPYVDIIRIWILSTYGVYAMPSLRPILFSDKGSAYTHYPIGRWICFILITKYS